MKITEKIVEYISDVAKISLTKEEIERFTADMTETLSQVEKLNELDTENVPPAEHITALENVFREDIIEKSYDRDVILAGAPSHEDGCFAVPKVLE